MSCFTVSLRRGLGVRGPAAVAAAILFLARAGVLQPVRPWLNPSGSRRRAPVGGGATATATSTVAPKAFIVIGAALVACVASLQGPHKHLLAIHDFGHYAPFMETGSSYSSAVLLRFYTAAALSNHFEAYPGGGGLSPKFPVVLTHFSRGFSNLLIA